MTPNLSRFAPFAALLGLLVVAYWPGLSGGFLFDDYPNIVHQEKVHATELSLATMKEAADGYGGWAGRPIVTISFAINHAFSGLDPWSYKLVGLVVHLFNALLVFLLTKCLLSIAGIREAPVTMAAFAVALIWAVHPLQVSTVLYVVQRMETMSLTFVLGALLCYLRGRLLQIAGERAWPWLLACVPLVLLGLLCKETAALFPAYTLTLELTVLGFVAKQAKSTRAWKITYAIGLAAAAAIFFLVVLPKYSSPEVYALRDYTLAERLLTQLRVLPMYLGWIVLPQPGNYVFYYDNFPPSQGLLQPLTTLLGGAFILALMVFAVAVRRRMPLMSLGIMWFFAAHLITSNVVPLELVFEHRNYFAILGVLLVGADMLGRMPTGEIPRIRQFTVGVLAVGALLLTLIRSAGWGNPTQLALELAQKNPTSSRASTDLGEQYMIRAGRDPTSDFYAMAEAEYERGSRLPNASPMPEQGLLVLAATAGRPAKPEWWDRIVQKLTTRAIGPQEFSMLTGLLRLRNDGMPLDDARFADAYLVLVNRVQLPASQYYAFGQHALVHLKDEPLANSLFKRAVDNSVGQPRLVLAMIDTLMREGHSTQARMMADHARAIGLADINIDDAKAAKSP